MVESITGQVTVPDGPTIKYTVYKDDPGNFHAVVLTETGSTRGFMQSEVSFLSHQAVRDILGVLWLKAILSRGTPESKEWAHLNLLMTRYNLIDYPGRQMHSA